MNKSTTESATQNPGLPPPKVAKAQRYLYIPSNILSLHTLFTALRSGIHVLLFDKQPPQTPIRHHNRQISAIYQTYVSFRLRAMIHTSRKFLRDERAQIDHGF